MVEQDLGQELPQGPNYQILYNHQQREVIRRRTVDMVIAAEDAEDMDMIIFLDKATRPIAQLFVTAWPALFPEESMPEVRHVNIGGEKVSILRKYVGDEDHSSPSIPIQDLLFQIRDEEDLKKIYGGEAVEELLELIGTGQFHNRLIVDVCTVTGETLLLTKSIFKAIDPTSDDSLLVLINDPLDRARFSGISNFPLIPWRPHLPSLFESPNEESFVINSSAQAEDSLLMREFEMLAQEIKKEVLAGSGIYK